MFKPRHHRIASCLESTRRWRPRAQTQFITAILLLVTYGPSAALGPHWHHHSHGESCSHGEAATDFESAQLACNVECSCSHHNAAQRQVVNNRLRVLVVSANASEQRAACAVCAYYGQSVLPFLTTSQAQSTICCTWAAAPPASAESCSLLRANSRGPPVECLSFFS